MRTIFISYRREDAEGQAGRLFDDLAAQFGEASVFMDVSGIAAGHDFRQVIDEHVSSCGVLLAVIGKGWLDARDEQGQCRLDDPADFVRLETVSALKRGIPVVPVLVHGARMPKAEQLPGDLAPLAYRNGVELTHARWDSDVQLLIKALDPYVDKAVDTAPLQKGSTVPRKTASRMVRHAVAASLVTLAIGGGAYTWNKVSSERTAVSAEQARQASLQLSTKKQAVVEREAQIAADAKTAAEKLAAEKQRAQQAKTAAAIAEERARAAQNARIALEKANQNAEARRIAEEKERVAADKLALEQKAEAERIAAEQDERRIALERRRQRLEAERKRLAAEHAAQAAAARADADKAARVGHALAGACISGYVWREAKPNDRVCVTPASRTQAAADNHMAPARRQPGGGAYGPATCKQGYVWREAFAGDTVCVTPEARTRTAEENTRAATRLVSASNPIAR